MSPDEVRASWARFLAGEEPSAEEQARLVAALEADPALRGELLEDVQLDGALRAMGDARRTRESFVAQVAGCLAPERDATRFIRKVEARLAEPPPEPAGTRDTRTGLVRVSRRFQRPDVAGAGWKAALVAAVAFFAVLLLATAFRSPAPRVVVKAPPPPAPLPVPERAAPEPERLQAIRVEEKKLRETPTAASETPEDRARALASLKAEREAIEKRMREELALRPAPPPVATPPKDALAPTRAEEGVAAPVIDLPLVERIEGNVYVGKSKVRARLGARLAEELETVGASSLAVLRYADGTRAEIGANSAARDASDVRGRRLVLVQGSLLSEIAKQPEGRPMVFATSHAEAVVLGTVLKLTTNASGTQLEVREGRVRMSRLSDGAAAEVRAGQTSSTADLAARTAFPDVITMNFGPSDTKLPPGVYNDSGEAFDPKLGYGWDGPRTGEPIPGALFPGAQGRPEPRLKGRMTALRGDPSTLGPLKATDVIAGWGAHAETWRILLPNGMYLVTVCVGDATFEQGPHHVAVEGIQLIDRVKTRQPRFFHEVKDVPVDVKDGELTMVVGGYPGDRKSIDDSKDTILNYVIIKRAPARK